MRLQDLQNHLSTSVKNLAQLNGAELLALVDEVESIMALSHEVRAHLEAAIQYRYRFQDQRIRSQSGQESGQVTFNDGTVNIVSEVATATVWDQKKLNDIAQVILQQGEDPASFMQVTYHVDAQQFDEWPEVIQQAFKPALMLQQGEVMYTLLPSDLANNEADPQ